MSKEEKKAPAKVDAPAKTEAPKVTESKDILPPAQRLGLKATYATLWQNASGKKGDPNEKDSAGSPVLEKYYRNWCNAD
ncbi:hypothetical protein GM539_14170 [Streptococcus pneumoniae]|uniref:Uncharacterized protein n=1 Tax=Streptococcus pneumoniae TaxID=1313 RepID=A0A6G2D6P5_STREE|nr:hypothetical protein [Streptococcus pneumoniae]